MRNNLGEFYDYNWETLGSSIVTLVFFLSNCNFPDFLPLDISFGGEHHDPGIAILLCLIAAIQTFIVANF